MILCTYLLSFLLRLESNSMNVSKWCFMDPIRSKWCISIDLLVHAICACSFKGERVIVFKWLSVVHLVLREVAIAPQGKSLKVFRDAVTGPNLCLTTDHMCLSHCLEFGGIQLSGCRNCFWTVSMLLSTLHPCRFPSIHRTWFLTRSYYRLSSFAVTSVDGCCLYIIIHNSISCRTWL